MLRTLFPERASYYERMPVAPATIAKLRGEYRWHLLIKNKKAQDPNGERIRRAGRKPPDDSARVIIRQFS